MCIIGVAGPRERHMTGSDLGGLQPVLSRVYLFRNPHANHWHGGLLHRKGLGCTAALDRSPNLKGSTGQKPAP